jgi:hypothetical protein
VTKHGTWPASTGFGGGLLVAKKKKKKGKNSNGGSALSSAGAAAAKQNSLKAMSKNPLAADIVAAALVATAAAIRNSKKARQLASEAGDELEKMSKQAAARGNAMWDLALDIGRRSLEVLSVEEETPKRAKSKTVTRPSGKAASRNAKKSPTKRRPIRKKTH